MKKLIILLFLVGGSVILFAQKQTTSKILTLHPIFGLDFNFLKIENSDWNALGLSTQINSLNTNNRVGFSLGTAYHFTINERFSIAPQSIISFQHSQLDYDLENKVNHTETVKPATLQFPIHMIFFNPKNEKFNPSIIFGGRYTYDISKKEASVRLNLKEHDFAIDVGTSFIIKLKQIHIRPEFIYSFGLTNLNPKDTEGLYHSAIKSIFRDNISFRLVTGLK